MFAGSEIDEPPYQIGTDDAYLGDDAGWQGRSRASCARSARA